MYYKHSRRLASKGAQEMKKVLFFALSLVILSAVAYLAMHKPEPQMIVRVGYIPQDLQYRGGPPVVEPIAGVEVLMVDRDFSLVNVKTTDKKGEVHWKRAEKPATIIVTVDGEKHSADIPGGPGTEVVVIGIPRPESFRSL